MKKNKMRGPLTPKKKSMLMPVSSQSAEQRHEPSHQRLSDPNGQSYVALCFALEKRQIASFWQSVVKALSGREWPNAPLVSWANNQIVMYVDWFTTWEKMQPSSRPPHAKSRFEWNTFTRGAKDDVVITQIMLEVDGPVTLPRLNSLIKKYDFLCDTGKPRGVYAAAYWGNLLTPESASYAQTHWAVLIEA